MTTAFLDDVANAPDVPDDLFGTPDIEADTEPPKRTNPERAKGRGSRTRERECEECGEEFVGGHKLCQECKGKSKPTTPRAPSGPRGSAKLEQELLESTISVASDISAVAPTLAGVLIARAEVAVSGMMQLSKGHPRVQKMLQKSASASKIADLMSTIAMVVIAAMVDFGRLPLESPLLDRLGYADIVRDENGKAKRDPSNGTIVKERRTLREIHDMMTGEETSSGGGLPDMNGWDPNAPSVVGHTGTGYTTVPPMNWTP